MLPEAHHRRASFSLNDVFQMETTILNATISPPDTTVISAAANVLRQGGLVAFPTETVYGLGADSMNAAAVERVFICKGRPPDNPVIVHIGDRSQLDSVSEYTSLVAHALAERFWPGPLTLVVNHRKQFPRAVTAGLPTVAVRIPNHPVALALIRELGHGIVGPSANLSGKPSPTTAQHVLHDLGGRIEIILDAGPTLIGVESTVIDVTTSPPTILRLGGLARETIEGVVGTLATSHDLDTLKRSPGTRHRHYAPDANVELIEAGDSARLEKLIVQYRGLGKRVACILHSLNIEEVNETLLVVSTDVNDYARYLFQTMRIFDEQKVDLIIVESVPEVGVGEAVMDRLRRAAEKK